MQEELHFNLRVPGSNPGCAFGAVAQRIEHQTPFAGVVSPIVVAAGPAAGEGIGWLANAGGSTSGPTGFRPLGKTLSNSCRQLAVGAANAEGNYMRPWFESGLLFWLRAVAQWVEQ